MLANESFIPKNLFVKPELKCVNKLQAERSPPFGIRAVLPDHAVVLNGDRLRIARWIPSAVRNHVPAGPLGTWTFGMHATFFIFRIPIKRLPNTCTPSRFFLPVFYCKL
jgi:hypothetical protein